MSAEMCAECGSCICTSCLSDGACGHCAAPPAQEAPSAVAEDPLAPIQAMLDDWNAWTGAPDYEWPSSPKDRERLDGALTEARRLLASAAQEAPTAAFEGTPTAMFGIDPKGDERHQRTIDQIEEAERG